MKKFLMFFGILFFILILALAVFIGYFAYHGHQLDASSQLYVDQSVPAIVTTWSKDELTKRASLQLRQKTTDKQVVRLFSNLSAKLGPFKSYDGAKGESRMGYSTQNGKMITASYVARATFQNGVVKINIVLIQVQKAWQILGFYVDIDIT